MKVSKEKLKQMIKEELEKVMKEGEELEEIKGAAGSALAGLKQGRNLTGIRSPVKSAVDDVAYGLDEPDPNQDWYDPDEAPGQTKDEAINSILQKLGIDPSSKLGMQIASELRAAGEKVHQRAAAAAGSWAADPLRNRERIQKAGEEFGDNELVKSGPRKGMMKASKANALKKNIKKGLGLEESWEDEQAEDFPADPVGSSNRPVWGPKDGGANDFGMGADNDLAAAAKAEKGKDLSHDDLYRDNDDSTYALDRLVGKTLPFYGLKVNGEHGSKGSLTAVDEADNLEFALGNTIYRAVAGADWGKDWVDGIRQSGRIKAKGLKPEAVVKVEKGSFGAFDGFKLVDEKTGKPVALIGTDNSDSYYPLVVFTSDPTDIENVLDNGGVAGLDEMENLRESFRRFTKLPKAVLKD